MDILDKDRLKECRLKLGITKQEAAKRIQISQPAYLRYKAGSRNPSIQIISKMAEVFSTSTDYLIGKSTDSTPNRIIIEQSESPSLFSLIEICRTLNIDQLARLTTYAKVLSDITPVHSHTPLSTFSHFLLSSNSEPYSLNNTSFSPQK